MDAAAAADMPNVTHQPHKPRGIKGFVYNLLLSRHLIALLYTVVALGSLSVLFDELSLLPPNPVSIPSQCRIVSTSVDLRSSKVCELGLLNYKAKHVFYPSQTTKFRCRHDYYWASVFKVEYREYSSGQTRRALAEVPKEALPIDCRPNFGVAWLTKEKFKVNGTYNCRYTPGISEVDIYSDSLFNCHAKDPSIAEMIRRYFIIFSRMIYSLLFAEGRSEFVTPELLAGMLTGILTALMSVGLIRLLQILKFKLAKNSGARRPHPAVNWNHVKRVCFRLSFLVAYLLFMGWLTMQYAKILGLTKIFTNY